MLQIGTLLLATKMAVQTWKPMITGDRCDLFELGFQSKEKDLEVHSSCILCS